jgi:enoyl-CoA hydratase
VNLVLRHLDESGVQRLTLNRPEVRNALDSELGDALLAAVEEAATDPAVRAVVLTGAGDRAFAAGADINELRDRTHLTETSSVSSRRRVARLLETMPKPTIAALNGHALGGGLEIALGCDFRLAVPKATFGFPEITLGIMPGNGGTQRTARLVGEARALELVLTGERISADRAEHIGLVHAVVEPTELLDRAHALAVRLAGHSPRAYAAAKDATRRAFDMPLEAGLSYEHKAFAILCGTPEKQHLVDAYLDGKS